MVRIKHRYVLVRFEFEDSAHVQNLEDKVKHGLRNELIANIGSLRYHIVNPYVIKVDSGTLIIRCSLEGMPMLIAALAVIKSIGNENVAFYTIKSSGTIRALTAIEKQ